MNFINLRIIEARDLSEANGKCCNGEFTDRHDLSDIVLPLTAELKTTLLIEDQKTYPENGRSPRAIETTPDTAEQLLQARHLLAMMCETIETLDPTFYSSSDLIMYADDWEKLVANEEPDPKTINDNLNHFINVNSSLEVK